MGSATSKSKDTPQPTQVSQWPVITFQPSTQSDDSSMAKLPKQLIFELGKYLTDKGILSLSATSKRYHTFLSEDEFWTNRWKKADKNADSSCPKLKYSYFKNHSSVIEITFPIEQYSLIQYRFPVVPIGSSIMKKKLFEQLKLQNWRQAYNPFHVSITIDPNQPAKDELRKISTTCAQQWQYQEKYLEATFWDITNGESQVHNILEALSNEHPITLFLYSTSDKSSFEALNKYYEQISSLGISKEFAIVVSISNAVPAAKNKPMVTSVEGLQWASKHEMNFIEVSTTTGTGIRTLIKMILDCAIAWNLKPDANPMQSVDAMIANAEDSVERMKNLAAQLAKQLADEEQFLD